MEVHLGFRYESEFSCATFDFTFYTHLESLWYTCILIHFFKHTRANWFSLWLITLSLFNMQMHVRASNRISSPEKVKKYGEQYLSVQSSFMSDFTIPWGTRCFWWVISFKYVTQYCTHAFQILSIYSFWKFLIPDISE